ncbi:MAG TPA: hypothetical protein VFH39_00375 [Candidatus Saccharimonadales bacterium]|nr:hypothetical protein [Candidatus Saccharimonadales bacterium]
MSSTITATDLGLDLRKADEQTMFKWFLASYLFGKRIQQDIAKRTWEVFMHAGIDTPRKIHNRSWQELVDLLGEGHYKRYDESTARNLLDMSQQLLDDYKGKLTTMRAAATSKADFGKKLQQLKGVGPKTAEIFLREL